MYKLKFFFLSFISMAIGYVIAFGILLRLFISFIKSPIKFTRDTFFKRRDVMPSCLNDPSLGTHGFIHLEDVKLHYVSCGDEDKPLMLCLHGFPEFWYSWRYQIREFSKDYRVVAVDQRGYGDSDKPAGYQNYYIEKLAGDIKQLIPALGHSSCTLLAHDWGGAVAWNFTTHYSSLVDKLIIFNCPHPGTFQRYLSSNRKQMMKSWYMMFFQTKLVPELLMMANDLKALEMIFTTSSAEDIEAYKYAFSSKGYESCTLLAHDWGGVVAWNFTTVNSEMVDKLVVFNAPHPGTFATYMQENAEQRKKSWYTLFFQTRLVPELMLMANDMHIFDMMFSKFDNNKTSDSDIQAYKYAFSNKGGISCPLNWYRAAFTRAMTYNEVKIGKIDLPTLVIWGDPDTALNTELAQLCDQFVTNLTVKIVRNTNHFVHLDRPDECNKLVREFLEKK